MEKGLRDILKRITKADRLVCLKTYFIEIDDRAFQIRWVEGDKIMEVAILQKVLPKRWIKKMDKWSKQVNPDDFYKFGLDLDKAPDHE